MVKEVLTRRRNLGNPVACRLPPAASRPCAIPNGLDPFYNSRNPARLGPFAGVDAMQSRERPTVTAGNAFDFLERPPRAEKPRSRGDTVASDKGQPAPPING